MDKNALPSRTIFQSHRQALCERTDAAAASPLANELEIAAQKLARCSTAEARAFLNYERSREYGVLPLGIISLGRGSLATYAASLPPCTETLAALRFCVGTEVKILNVAAAILGRARFIAYYGDDALLLTTLNRLRTVTPETSTSDSLLAFRPRSGEAAQFFVALFEYALAHRATDIHLIPTGEGTEVRLRIDGALLSHAEPVCSLSLHQQLIGRVKVLSTLNTTIHAAPQEGQFSVPMGRERVHVRVSIMPTVYGEKAVLRLHHAVAGRDLPSLGLPPPVLDWLLRFLKEEEGMMLCAGATGSGKSTTLYSMMHYAAQRSVSVVSVEDPVECYLPGVSQTSVAEAQGLSYEALLASLLRQDPDVIMIGEIRDPKSAKVAFQAALTGHLVMSTVHARNSAEVLLRVTNLGVDALTMHQSLRLILSQRLVPTLCPHCKKCTAGGRLGESSYSAVGCSLCAQSGYMGRALAVECLEVEARTLHGHPAVYSDILRESRRFSFAESLASLCKAGQISPSQCESEVSDPSYES